MQTVRTTGGGQIDPDGNPYQDGGSHANHNNRTRDVECEGTDQDSTETTPNQHHMGGHSNNDINDGAGRPTSGGLEPSNHQLPSHGKVAAGAGDADPSGDGHTNYTHNLQLYTLD